MTVRDGLITESESDARAELAGEVCPVCGLPLIDCDNHWGVPNERGRRPWIGCPNKEVRS